MAVSKVILNGNTLIDVTDKTVTSSTLVSPNTALGADGTTVTGALVTKSASDVTVSGATTTIPAGVYSSQIQKTVSSGNAGTPTATKGTVSNHSVSVTPKVTNITGYITGSTKTGTPVTVSASELVSGTKTISSSGTTNVTNYASASVASGSARTPATTITANPTISVSASGLITASVSKTQNVTPTVSAGYVVTGTSGTITVNGSNTQQLTIYNGAHHQPTPSSYTVAVSLTNPFSPSDFSACYIYDAPTSDPEDAGSSISSISTASGSTEVLVDSASYGIIVFPTGRFGESFAEENISCTGGATLTSVDCNMYGALFAITGDGTITIDGIDYGD